jgi:formylglycine-generating enzyme required for sulfatase activity
MVSCMSDLKRCYEILEIRPGSTYEEAKLAFRDMVSIWHPDKFSHNSRLKEKAEEKLKLINAAWEQLQAFFCQKEDAAAERPRLELAEPANARTTGERKHRQREGKTARGDCRFADLDCEPLVHLEQARKAYRHRFNTRNPDLDPSEADAPQVADTGSECIALDSRFPYKNSGGADGRETTGPRGIKGLRHDQGEGDVTRRQRDEREYDEKKTGGGEQHNKGDREHARRNKAAQPPHEDSFNDKDRKIILLSDSYLLGFLERKFVNWQQREREHKKQQDAAKDIAKKNKMLADLYLTKYKTWLAKEKSKYKTSTGIGSLFKFPIGGSSSKRFLLGVPDVTLTFVKGGSFFMGDGPGNLLDKLPGRSSEQPYRVVTVDDFYIGRYPVTVRQWAKAMGVEVEDGERDFPVVLTWEGIHEFILRLNNITGLKFRVPTEAEWEYAARCGGKDEDLRGIADEAAGHDQASPARCNVGQSKANGLGLFDMLGNSGEWVTGSSSKQTRQNGPLGIPRSFGKSGRQVIRGAVHRDLHRNTPVSFTFHSSLPSTDKGHRFSFRLVHAAF